MDLATIIGIIIGSIVVAGAILVGGSAGTFFNIPSLLIVVGGALGGTMVRFPLKTILYTLKLGSSMAFNQEKVTSRTVILEIVSLAQLARKGGALALESAEIEYAFLKKGITMFVDGQNEAFVRQALQQDRDLVLERYADGERIFRAIGEAAPAFGMIGTLVGLVQMLSSLSDPAAIGPAMAVALLTTLYGALISNIIALPIADKLASKLETESVVRTMVIEGVAQIQSGLNPDVLADYLQSFVPETDRHEMTAAPDTPAAEAA